MASSSPPPSPSASPTSSSSSTPPMYTSQHPLGPPSQPQMPPHSTLRHPPSHRHHRSLSGINTTHPRFSRLLTSVLGSPFLTTSDPDQLPTDLDLIDGSPTAVPRTYTVTRPPSPAPTTDFSIIGPDEADLDPFSYHHPSAYPYYPNPSPSPFSNSRRAMYSSPSLGNSPFIVSPIPSSPPNPLRNLLPRLWDALSSPGRSVLNLSSSSSPPRPAFSPSTSRHTLYGYSYASHKGKGKASGVASAYYSSESGYINYSDLPPLDGEEGELIDDEACFIDVRAVTGIDIITLLPPELALHILSLLCTPDTLPSILACLAVSRTWRRLASDNAVWRAMFLGRWGIVNLRKARRGRKSFRGKLLIRDGGVSPIQGGRNNRLEPHQHQQELMSLSTSSFGNSPRIRISRSGPGDWGRRSAMFGMSLSGGGNVAGSSGGRMQRLPQPPPLRQGFVFPSSSASASRLGSGSPSQPRTPSRAPSRNPSRTPSRASTPTPRVSTSAPPSPTPTPTPRHAPLMLDWRVLYKERMELDKRWDGTARSAGTIKGSHLAACVGAAPEKVWEPKVMRISGHSDSVYCLEFDSSRIITGSRDRTIKVWSLQTGKLLGTFWGAHRGSVLCLKFEGDWEDGEVDENGNDGDMTGAGAGGRNDVSDGPGDRNEGDVSVMREMEGKELELVIGRKGFMVSGSSDCSVCVWDLWSVPTGAGSSEQHQQGWSEEGHRQNDGEGEQEEREVKAEVRAVLKGHVGGVLDLRIDKRWIVSCSKDAVIRVWDRKTLELHRTLRGHEGPVNAVGLQSGRVVSASGDGKMILWDIASGERLRTFEGHDRGLACIEFKDDLIVSGSNDCKIKIWSASTGECLRTLVGHEALVRALSFDVRSGRLVSASYDKSVKVWDLCSGKMVREFKGTHTSHIFDVKFDVARIVSTSHDQKIVVLDFSSGLDGSSLFV